VLVESDGRRQWRIELDVRDARCRRANSYGGPFVKVVNAGCPRLGRASLSVEGGGEPGRETAGARRAVRLLYAVRLAAGPVFVVRAVLSKIERGPPGGGCSQLDRRCSRALAGLSPPSSTDVAWIVGAGGGQSARASAQQKPASSRATATATIVERFPR
jgi:hypothetical protein